MKKLIILLLAFVAISASSYAFSLRVNLTSSGNQGQKVVEYTNPGISYFYYSLRIYRATTDNNPWRWLTARVNSYWTNGQAIDYVIDKLPNPGQNLYKSGWSAYYPGYSINFLQVIVNSNVTGNLANAQVYW
jgi:hypothetical protein